MEWGKSKITKLAVLFILSVFLLEVCFPRTVSAQAAPEILTKKIQTITASDLSEEMGRPNFFLDAKTDGNGTLTYASSNTEVARINEFTGEVELTGVGITQIVIHASATEEYEEAFRTIQLKVKKGDVKLKVPKISYTKTYKDKAFFLGASARSTVRYKSSNSGVVKVDSRGKVTVKGCGEAVITVTAGDSDYKSASRKITVKVLPGKSLLKSVSNKIPGQLNISWTRQKEADGYMVEYAPDKKFKKHVGRIRIGKNSVTRTNLKGLTEGRKYYIRVKAYKIINHRKVYGKASKVVSKTVKKEPLQTTARPGKRTLLNLLFTAKIPLGHTMYVWGGGWNESDTGAGEEAVSIGESPRWRAFYELQDSSYNYRNTRYQIHDGLDCSGYVGWVVYNVMETADGRAGYVEKASGMAESFAMKGFGSYTPARNVTDWKPGDIMSMSGHVWISLGMCEDGSVVLLHASPPGVLLCGTRLPDGRNSRAAELAEYYMRTYYPDWYKKFPDCTRPASYLTGSGQMRWNSGLLTDKEGIRKLGAEEVLKKIFP